MKTFQLFFTILAIQQVAGQRFSWFPSFDQKHEEPKSQVVVKTGVPPPPPPTVYEPSKPMEKEHKEKKEWIEKCTTSFSKDDILMLNLVRKNAYGAPTVFPPIILPSESVQFTFLVEKRKPHSASKKLLKALKLSNFKGDEGKLPISLLLDADTVTLLPVISPEDLFILTIITKNPKKGLTLKSHFVDEIKVKQSVKKDYY